jgi:hypothetical protein
MRDANQAQRPDRIDQPARENVLNSILQLPLLVLQCADVRIAGIVSRRIRSVVAR